MFVQFVSFAQNFEDVVLWRALGNQDSGFYIDIGAGHPSEDSVTKAFYDRGWRGINVEPVAEYFRALVEARPRDTSLEIAITNVAGQATMNIFKSSGLSTLDDGIATLHEANGMQKEVRKVECLPLRQIVEKYVPPGQEIHFLKIDVEGLEKEVLQSADWKSARPWVILIEATYPNSQAPTHQLWEELLLKNDYIQAYFDGLNRFYVAKEHSDLIPKLSVPPNVWDQFIRSADLLWRNQAQSNASKVATLESYQDTAEKTIRALEKELLIWSARSARVSEATQMRATIRLLEKNLATVSKTNRHDRKRVGALKSKNEGLRHTRAWQFTAPMRFLVETYRMKVQPALRSPRSFLFPLAAHLIDFVKSHPALRFRLVGLIRAIGLEHQARRVAWRLVSPTGRSSDNQAQFLESLSPAALNLFFIMKRGLQNQRSTQK